MSDGGLIHQCLERPPGAAGRDLPVVVMAGPPGPGRTAVLDAIASRCREVPSARLDFATAGAMRPRHVAVSLWFQLAAAGRRSGRLRFPRLLLGLLAVRANLDPQDRDRAARDLREVLSGHRSQAAARRHVDDIANDVLDHVSPSVPLPVPEGGAAMAVDWVVFSVLRRGRFAAALRWYGRSGRDPLAVLVDLHRADHDADGTVSESAAVDEVLCEAFLADLAAAFAGWGRRRNCVALLDNAESGAAERFVATVARIRGRQGPGEQDPLVVVAARRPGLDGEWQRRETDADLSYGDWQRGRLDRAEPRSWSYVVRLGEGPGAACGCAPFPVPPSRRRWFRRGLGVLAAAFVAGDLLMLAGRR